MKTPDEIKKGLECCIADNGRARCKECPYAGDTGFYHGCMDRNSEDALAYIQQLERERDATVEALCKVNRILSTNGWAGTALCMSEVRDILWDGFLDVLCAKEVE